MNKSLAQQLTPLPTNAFSESLAKHCVSLAVPPTLSSKSKQRNKQLTTFLKQSRLLLHLRKRSNVLHDKGFRGVMSNQIERHHHQAHHLKPTPEPISNFYSKAGKLPSQFAGIQAPRCCSQRRCEQIEIKDVLISAKFSI
jgi:hypothetical protein